MKLLLLLLSYCGARRRIHRYSCERNTTAGANISGAVCAPARANVQRRHLGPTWKLRWLHVPKTGTTLASAIYRSACERLPPHASIPAPTDAYPGHVQDYFAQCFPEEANAERCALDASDTFAPKPTHVPLALFAPDRFAYATILRDPWARLLSAYGWKRQFFDCGELTAACAARNRGIYVNFILGNWTSGPNAPPARYPSAADAKTAADRLESFAFVGLFERYTDSLCLFAATFGTYVARGDLVNTRPGAAAAAPPRPPDLADWADGRLYAYGAALFEKRLRAAFWPD